MRRRVRTTDRADGLNACFDFIRAPIRKIAGKSQLKLSHLINEPGPITLQRLRELRALLAPVKPRDYDIVRARKSHISTVGLDLHLAEEEASDTASQDDPAGYYFGPGLHTAP